MGADKNVRKTADYARKRTAGLLLFTSQNVKNDRIFETTNSTSFLIALCTSTESNAKRFIFVLASTWIWQSFAFSHLLACTQKKEDLALFPNQNRAQTIVCLKHLFDVVKMDTNGHLVPPQTRSTRWIWKAIRNVNFVAQKKLGNQIDTGCLLVLVVLHLVATRVSRLLASAVALVRRAIRVSARILVLLVLVLVIIVIITVIVAITAIRITAVGIAAARHAAHVASLLLFLVLAISIGGAA